MQRQTYFSYEVVYLNKKDLIRFYDCTRASTFCATQIIFTKRRIPMRDDLGCPGEHAACSLLLSVEQLPHIACTFKTAFPSF